MCSWKCWKTPSSYARGVYSMLCVVVSGHGFLHSLPACATVYACVCIYTCAYLYPERERTRVAFLLRVERASPRLVCAAYLPASARYVWYIWCSCRDDQVVKHVRAATGLFSCTARSFTIFLAPLDTALSAECEWQPSLTCLHKHMHCVCCMVWAALLCFLDKHSHGLCSWNSIFLGGRLP